MYGDSHRAPFTRKLLGRALAGAACRPAALRRRASRPQLKRDPLGARERKAQLVNILVRLSFALLGVALLRDGYAGLRGRELWLQGKGFNWVFLRGRTGRLAGAFFVLAGLVFLSVAWFGL